MLGRLTQLLRGKPAKSRTVPDARIESLMTENARLFEELERVQQRFRSLARGTWRVQEDERRQLGRELHDHLGQSLTAVIHRLEEVPQPHRDPCLELARQALEDVRELSRLLRPPVLDDLGLGAALEWLGRRSGKSAGLSVEVRTANLPERLDSDLETLMFRMAQEALGNAVRHARASRIEITLSRSGNLLELWIRDDGVGFDPDHVAEQDDRGIGLAGMQDRIGLFGGELAINSAPGRGTAITATISLPTQDHREAQP